MKKSIILVIIFMIAFFISSVYGQEVKESITIQNNTIIVNGIITEAFDYGGNAYIGGDFSQIAINNASPVDKSYLAEIKNNDKSISSWDPEADGNIEAMVNYGNQIIVAGHFTHFGGKEQSYITSFDKNTHEINELGLHLDGPVYAMSLKGDMLYFGGGFTKINGLSRSHLASYNLSSHTLTDWNPNLNDTVFAMALDNNTLYVGGAFTQVDDIKRARLLAIDTTDDTLLDWNPDIKIIVRKIAINKGGIAVEGYLENEKSTISNTNIEIEQQTGKIISENTVVPTPTIMLPSDSVPTATGASLMVDQQALGFRIPTLSDILTFAIRAFFVIAGIAALFYMLLGAFAWVTSGGDKDAVSAAREKIQSAIVGVLVIVGVLAIVWTLEQVIFSGRICFGISCPVTLPSLIQPI
jgi:hypothetical protein